MSTFTNNWDAAWDANPVGTDNAALAHTHIRTRAQGLREILAIEHDFDTSDVPNQGKHLAGSAKAYYQSAAPTTSPGGDALGAEDAGRIFVDSDDDIAYVWNGSSFDSVSVSSSGASNGVVETGSSGDTIKCKVIAIGDWNMDSTGTVALAHGLTFDNIISVTARIRGDSSLGDTARSLDYESSSGANGYLNWDGTNVDLYRITGRIFDQSGYSDTSYNRGYVIIWYKV